MQLPLTPTEKYHGFREAIRTFNYYLEAENYIGAYVIAFSILEDRVNAMFAARKSESAGQDLTPRRLQRTGFVRKLEVLLKHGDLSQDDKHEFVAQAYDRNEKMHAAMWNLNEFNHESATSLLKSARKADRLRKVQKKLLAL